MAGGVGGPINYFVKIRLIQLPRWPGGTFVGFKHHTPCVRCTELSVHYCLKTEDNRFFSSLEDNLNFLRMEDDLKYLKWKMTYIFLKMEANLSCKKNIFSNGRRPQF